MKWVFDASDLVRTAQAIGASERRLRAVAATALTRTAVRVKEAERREMVDVFDRPTPYTLGSLYATIATAANPVATVGVKDDFGGKRSPLAWLRWQIKGGLRTQTAFEKALVRGGAMRDDQRAVPGAFARMDAFGNMSRGQRIQILSQLRIGTGVLGSERRLPQRVGRDSPDFKAVNAKIKRAYSKAGGQFLALPNGRGKLKPGVYITRQFASGRSDPRPVLIFVQRASYEPERFDFGYVAQVTIKRELPLQLKGELARSLFRSGLGPDPSRARP
jgi:hypothetical protein